MFPKDGKVKDVITPRICDVVWHDGQFIKWTDARVHVMSHVLHYGSSIFEGIRCYATNSGPAIFRLKEHMQRFLNSAKIYRMDHSLNLNQLCEASVELVQRSGLDQCYIRPILFRSLDEANPAFGVNPFPNPLACYIGAWDWGKYLGDEAIEKGVDVCVSTWNRLTPNSMPAMAKKYLSDQRWRSKHATPVLFNIGGNHARQRDSDLRRVGDQNQGEKHSARSALCCG